MNQKLILVNKEEEIVDTVEVSESVIANIINGDISTTIKTDKKTYEIASINNYEVLVSGKVVTERLTLEIVE